MSDKMLLPFKATTEGFDKVKNKINGLFDRVKAKLKDSMPKGGMLGTLFGGAGGGAIAAIGGLTLAFTVGKRALQSYWNMAKGLSAQLDQIAKSARRTGVSFGEYQRLSFAAELTGATTENVERTFRTFQQRWLDLQMMDEGTVAQVFKAIKLKKSDLDGLSEFEKFVKVMNQVNQIKDKGTRSGVAQRLGGRGGTQTLPMIQALAEAERMMESLDLNIPDSALHTAEEFDDELVKINKQFQVFAANHKMLDPLVATLKHMNVLMFIFRQLMKPDGEQVRPFKDVKKDLAEITELEKNWNKANDRRIKAQDKANKGGLFSSELMNERVNEFIQDMGYTKPGSNPYVGRRLQLMEEFGKHPGREASLKGLDYNDPITELGQYWRNTYDELNKQLPNIPEGTETELFNKNNEGKFGKMKSSFETAGGFMTAGMRVHPSSIGDPVVSELQKQTVLMEEIRENISQVVGPRATPSAAMNDITPSRWWQGSANVVRFTGGNK